MSDKYRVWSKLEKRWASDVVVTPNGGLMIDEGRIIPAWFEAFNPEDYEVDFFTDIKDTQGRRLSAGDIVEVPGFGVGVCGICSLHGLVFNSGDGREVPYIDCAAEGDFPTLIGNIHENPELIP